MTLLKAACAIAAIGLAASIPGCTPKRPHSVADWAYAINSGAAPAAADDGEKLNIPDSDRSYTRTELRNLFSAPDWRPQEHPPMPAIVAGGRAPEVQACGFCHLPTGNGRPENARLAGLPYNYIVSQLLAYRSGLRKSSIVGHLPSELMAAIGKAATDQEIADAAAYFSTLEPRAFISVVETGAIPETEIAGWVFKTVDGDRREPIGMRIIETPEDFDEFELRNPETRYIAYAPVGSIARGKALAGARPAPNQLACADCHGADFRGAGDIPGLAGRSPSYIARQLNDFRSGARRGASSDQMAPIADRLEDAEILAIAAYLASLQP